MVVVRDVVVVVRDVVVRDVVVVVRDVEVVVRDSGPQAGGLQPQGLLESLVYPPHHQGYSEASRHLSPAPALLPLADEGTLAQMLVFWVPLKKSEYI